MSSFEQILLVLVIVLPILFGVASFFISMLYVKRSTYKTIRKLLGKINKHNEESNKKIELISIQFEKSIEELTANMTAQMNEILNLLPRNDEQTKNVIDKTKKSFSDNFANLGKNFGKFLKEIFEVVKEPLKDVLIETAKDKMDKYPPIYKDF
jgi:hypothetical protein